MVKGETRVMKYIKCPICGGTGLSNKTIFCTTCLGRGKIKKPLSNEEWLRSCSTEELAEFLAYECGEAITDYRDNNSMDLTGVYRWQNWLQEKHHDNP